MYRWNRNFIRINIVLRTRVQKWTYFELLIENWRDTFLKVVAFLLKFIKIWKSDLSICPWIQVYVLGFCSYIGKCGSEKNFIFAYIMQCPTESIGKLRYNTSIGKLRYNTLLQCNCKNLCTKRQTCCTDKVQCIFSCRHK